MAVFLVFFVAVAVGVLVSRFAAKRGSGKKSRRLFGLLAWFLAAMALSPLVTNENPPNDRHASGATHLASTTAPSTDESVGITDRVKSLDSGIYRVTRQTAARPHRLVIMLKEKGSWDASSTMSDFANHAVSVLHSAKEKNLLPSDDTVWFIMRVQRTDDRWVNAVDVRFPAQVIAQMDLRPFRMSAAQVLNQSDARVRNATGRQLVNGYCGKHAADASAFCAQVSG